MAVSVGVGLGMLHVLMEAEVDEVVGPKRRHIPDRAAVRHRHEDGEVTLGGRRVTVSRPRARTADGAQKVELVSYAHFAARDRLSLVMLAGVSTRRYARKGEPVGSEIDEGARSTSKSAVSREFVSRTCGHLIELEGRCCVVALGIDTDGVKHPLRLWDGGGAAGRRCARSLGRRRGKRAP
jgi:putative transposase